MIVPGTPGPAPSQDNQPKPSPSLLLMAAAQMHQLGKLGDRQTDKPPKEAA